MASAVEKKSYHFPLEVLTQILSYVDPHTLVFSCRCVCRFWREAVECSDLWKVHILREHGDKFESDNALSTAHVDYPWYICYAICRNVFDKNLFLGYEGSPRFWREAETSGHIWSEAIDHCTLGFDGIPQELIDEGETNCFVGVIGECRINHCVDLYAHGLTRKIMRLRPPIHVSEWFASRFDYISVCHIEVKLFNSQWQCNEQRDYLRLRRRLVLQQWHKVSHTFTNYSEDVRYVVFHHGMDSDLPGHYGLLRYLNCEHPSAKMMGTKLTVSRPDPRDPSNSGSSSSTSISSSRSSNSDT